MLFQNFIFQRNTHASYSIPQIEDPDVLLLKKARQEKKVKRYLEDNFQNREGQ